MKYRIIEKFNEEGEKDLWLQESEQGDFWFSIAIGDSVAELEERYKNYLKSKEELVVKEWEEKSIGGVQADAMASGSSNFAPGLEDIDNI